MAREILTGIYKITNLDNGKMYVGQATDIYTRWSQHKAGLRHNNHENKRLQYSWNLHGEDSFQFSIIEECNYDELDEREMFWISELKTYVGFDDCNGYNLTIGGQGTKYIHKTLQFDLDGNFIKEWNSPREASYVLGINIQAIVGSCKRNYKHGNGYIWIYKEDYIDESSLEWYMNRKCMNRVLQYDRHMNLVNTFDSLAQATEMIGSGVASCVSHNCATSHGYIFIYEKERDIITKDYCEWAFTRLNNISNMPFYQLDKNGIIIKKYNCLREAEEDGYNEKMINDCVRGLRDKYKNYLWCYVNDVDKYTPEYCMSVISAKTKRVNYPILQYKDGVLVNRYDKLCDIPKEFLKANVADACKGRKPQYKGYVWKYEIND